MHVRELERTLIRIATSLKETGALIMVTNVVEGPDAAMAAFLETNAGIMPLVLQARGNPIPVSNYVRTQDAYTQAFQQAGLNLVFCEKYEPKILRFATEPPGIRLSHLVLVGKT
jgi:hypothetical protein